MRKVFTFIASFIAITSLSAQTAGQVGLNSTSGGASGEGNSQISYLLGGISDRDTKTLGSDYGIQGSAYATEKFIAAKLYYNSEFEGDIFYRYNAYNEEIEIKDSNLANASIKTLNIDKKISINLSDGNQMKFKTYIDKNNRTQNGYLTKLNEGKYSLYKRVDVKYTQGQKSQNSFVPAIPARFTKFTEYYIEIKGVNRIDELELNNRKFLKIVPEEHKEKTKAFLKKERIKVKNENTLIKIINYLNSNS